MTASLPAQAADVWRGLGWCRRWDCYVAHTGSSGVPAALALPTSYNARCACPCYIPGAAPD